MTTNKGPQVIRYCVITSTASLVLIAGALFPQFKVNKAKLLCAEYFSQKDTTKGVSAGEKIQKKFIVNEEWTVDVYCRSL